MPDSTEVQWVEFVPERRSFKAPAYGYDVLDALRANPGRWAKIHTYAVTGSASSARHSLIGKGYEAKTRGGDLYAMWPGDPDASPADLRPDGPTPIRRNPSARPKSNRLPYVCDYCDGDFTTPSALKHHVARQHPEEVA